MPTNFSDIFPLPKRSSLTLVDFLRNREIGAWQPKEKKEIHRDNQVALWEKIMTDNSVYEEIPRAHLFGEPGDWEVDDWELDDEAQTQTQTEAEIRRIVGEKQEIASKEGLTSRLVDDHLPVGNDVVFEFMDKVPKYFIPLLASANIIENMGCLNVGQQDNFLKHLDCMRLDDGLMQDLYRYNPLHNDLLRLPEDVPENLRAALVRSRLNFYGNKHTPLDDPHYYQNVNVQDEVLKLENIQNIVMYTRSLEEEQAGLPPIGDFPNGLSHEDYDTILSFLAEVPEPYIPFFSAGVVMKYIPRLGETERDNLIQHCKNFADDESKGSIVYGYKLKDDFSEIKKYPNQLQDEIALARLKFYANTPTNDLPEEMKKKVNAYYAEKIQCMDMKLPFEQNSHPSKRMKMDNEHENNISGPFVHESALLWKKRDGEVEKPVKSFSAVGRLTITDACQLGVKGYCADIDEEQHVNLLRPGAPYFWEIDPLDERIMRSRDCDWKVTSGFKVGTCIQKNPWKNRFQQYFNSQCREGYIQRDNESGNYIVTSKTSGKIIEIPSESLSIGVVEPCTRMETKRQRQAEERLSVQPPSCGEEEAKQPELYAEFFLENDAVSVFPFVGSKRELMTREQDENRQAHQGESWNIYNGDNQFNRLNLRENGGNSGRV